MSEIRRVELGTFVSSADAAERVRKAADQVQRRDPRDNQQRERPRDEPADTSQPPDEDDLATGAYDDHGRPRDRSRVPARSDDRPTTGPSHLNIVV